MRGSIVYAVVDIRHRPGLPTLLGTPTYVTTHVWREVADDTARPGARALLASRNAGVLVVVEEGDANAFPQLDSGESTVLSAAAAAARAAVLVDERRARAVINTSPGLRDAIAQVTGIIGLMLLAKDRGQVAAVRPLLDDLLAHRFRISPALYLDALRRAGER